LFGLAGAFAGFLLWPAIVLHLILTTLLIWVVSTKDDLIE
jgi:hypothetical protein